MDQITPIVVQPIIKNNCKITNGIKTCKTNRRSKRILKLGNKHELFNIHYTFIHYSYTLIYIIHYTVREKEVKNKNQHENNFTK